MASHSHRRPGSLCRHRAVAESVAAALVALGDAACASAEIPDPQPVVAQFESAAAQGDAETVHLLLRARDKQRLSVADVKDQMKLARHEVGARARAAASPEALVRVEVELWTARGEPVRAVEEHGTYRIDEAGWLLSRPETPLEALALLREALASRNYRGLLRILTRREAHTLEREFSSIERGLDDPERLDVRVDGDTAVAMLPGGHQVRLRREDGLWKVEDFQ